MGFRGPKTELTESQWKLVKDNIKLAYFLVKRSTGLSTSDPRTEPYLDEAMDTLMRCAQTYDPMSATHAQFSTYAYKSIRRNLSFPHKKEIIRNQKFKSLSLVDYDSVKYKDTRLMDIKEFINHILDQMDEQARQVHELLMEGLDQVQISKRMGVTKQRISAIIRHNRLLAKLYAGDIAFA